MRKDVRFGLAIGGVLLAVIVVYTLSVRKKPVQTAADPTPAVEQTASTDIPPTPVEPTHEQPRNGTEVASAQQPDPFATTVTPHDTGHETGPAVSATPNDPRSVTDWNQLLATGQPPPTVTSTPTGGEAQAMNHGGEAQPAGSTTGASEGSATTGGEGSGGAAANTPAATDGSPGQARTYKVQKGDTLSSIAQTAYGSANYYPHILRANPGLDPHKLRPGMTINLPDRQQVVPQGATQASEESNHAATVDASRQYRVQAGDSLYKISVKLYGNGGYVDKIYEKNKQAIGADPARLKVGMVLELPEAPTVAQAR